MGKKDQKKRRRDLLRKINGALVAKITYTAVRLGFFEVIPLEGITVDDLQEKMDINPKFVHKFLGVLVVLCFIEEKEGRYFLSEEGALLSSSHKESLRSIALYKGSPFYWNAVGKLHEALIIEKEPFFLAHDMHLFSYLETHTEDARVFHDAMESFQKTSSKKIFENYDFACIKTIVDIGGGGGSCLEWIIDTHKHLEGVVYDLPYVIDLYKHREKPRLEYRSGNFFSSVPSKKDCYILRNILHDWDDAACALLLGIMRKSMSQESRVLILETVQSLDPKDRIGKFSDWTLFCVTPGGRERTFVEIEALLIASGFSIKRVVQNELSKVLIEAGIESIP